MKKINYIKQPTDYLCGQACVAKLADVTVIQSYLEIYIETLEQRRSLTRSCNQRLHEFSTATLRGSESAFWQDKISIGLY